MKSTERQKKRKRGGLTGDFLVYMPLPRATSKHLLEKYLYANHEGID